MRYSASEKFEIIELVEQSSLSIRRTLAPIGIPRSTFYDWYSRYQEGGIEALVDGKPRPRRIWNKIPDKIETEIVNLALEEPDLSPRELAVNFTDTKGSFVSEATVYRLLKDHGLITSPAFILIRAADRFANPTTAPNQLWQTDFTYLKVIGWGWFYLSTVLDDFSRYILAWKLCTTMSATDVSDTLQVALQGSGLNQVKVLHRPRLLSDNGPSTCRASWESGSSTTASGISAADLRSKPSCVSSSTRPQYLRRRCAPSDLFKGADRVSHEEARLHRGTCRRGIVATRCAHAAGWPNAAC